MNENNIRPICPYFSYHLGIRGGGSDNVFHNTGNDSDIHSLRIKARPTISVEFPTLLRTSDRNETLVNFEDDMCVQGAHVVVAWKFAREEWAKPFVGRSGELVQSGKQVGMWEARFGDQIQPFHVGAQNVHHLAYFDVSSPEQLYTLASSLLAVGGDIKGAKLIFERALALDPENVNCLSGYGMLIHSRFHNCSGAETFFKQALQLAPQHVDTLCNYGAVLLDESNKDYQVY